MKIASAKKLAELTGNAVGSRTIEAVEAGERVISTSNYNVLEIALKLPIGTMESVLRGDVTEFPGDVPAAAPSVPDGGEAMYTKAEIRGIYRALGPAGFEEWLSRPATAGAGVRTTG
jgi:hypothetical protein